jgi:hypothetical protein
MEVPTTMNMSNTESPMIILAKTCGCKEKNKNVTYTFIDSYHSLCLDKKDIISGEIEACNRLSKYTQDERDKEVIEKEIAELKMSLDSHHCYQEWK